MNNRNYQKELDKIIDRIAEQQTGRREDFVEDYAPRLLLHSCCAPCSSYVLEYLRNYFRITVFYYNPNITEDEEYRKRVAEQKRLIEAYNAKLREQAEGAVAYLSEPMEQERTTAVASGPERRGYLIEVIEGDYEPERFFDTARGLEQCQAE